MSGKKLLYATPALVAAIAAVAIFGVRRGNRLPGLGEPVTLAANGASNPTTAADPRSGATYVAWVGIDSSGSNVYLRRSATPGTFDPPVQVNDRWGDAAPHEQAPAQVAVGADGNVYVAWQSTRPKAGLMFGAADIRLARSTDGGRTFEPAISVNDDAGKISARHTFHNLTVAPNGSIYVSWIDARVRDSLRVALAARGLGAHDPGNTKKHKAPAVAEPGTDIRVAWSTDQGRSFNVGVVVDTNSCPCCRTSIAVGTDGSVYVAWRKIYPGEVRDIVVARSRDGGQTWGAPVKVHDDGWVFPGCPHAGPSVAVDGRGDVHVGWYTGAPSRPGLFYAVSTDGAATFGAPVPLATGAWVPVSQVKLAPAGGDAVWVAWDDRRAEEPALTFARGRSGQIEPFSSVPMRGTSPAIGAGPGGLSIAWLDRESVRVRVGR